MKYLILIKPIVMCGVLTMVGCHSSDSQLSFTSTSNNLYTYYYGQNLNDLFTGEDATLLYSVADDFNGPMPVVEIEFNENLYNHTQTVPVSVTSGSDSIARTIQLIILDQYPPEITVTLPEKPDKYDQITDIIQSEFCMVLKYKRINCFPSFM